MRFVPSSQMRGEESRDGHREVRDDVWITRGCFVIDVDAEECRRGVGFVEIREEDGEGKEMAVHVGFISACFNTPTDREKWKDMITPLLW